MSSRYSGHRPACSRDLPSGQDGIPWRLGHLWACAVLQGQDEVLAPVTGTSNSGSLFSEAIGLQRHPWYDRTVSVKSSKSKYKENKTTQFNHVLILADPRTSEPQYIVHLANSVFASHFFITFCDSDEFRVNSTTCVICDCQLIKNHKSEVELTSSKFWKSHNFHTWCEDQITMTNPFEISWRQKFTPQLL